MPEPGVPSSLLREARRIRRRLDRTAGAALVRAGVARLAHRAPRRLCLVCDGRIYTSEQMFAPIFRHAARLALTDGIVVEARALGEVRAKGPVGLGPRDILGLMLPYDLDPAAEAGIVSGVIAPAKAAGVRVILFDGDDDLGVLWGAALGAADACLKKHVHKDRQAYARRTIGKTNLTDHVARRFGWSFADDIIPAAGGHSADAAARIALGWNIALDDKIADLARDLRGATRPRDIDVLCRASVGPHVWTHPMRNGAVVALNALAGEAVVHAPTDRVGQGAYYRELLSARMCLSPFGFGEICWRDFEAMLCGALLLKPDMSHLETWPDLFVPGVTYVPVAWDYSDLGAVVARYRADDAAREAITREAASRLGAALGPEAFLDRFRATVLGAASPPVR